jgi:hypothetical protein
MTLLRLARLMTSTSYFADEDDAFYCVPCFDAWRDAEDDGGSASATAAALSAQEQRNATNKSLLRQWFPRHCTHHLYYVHVRVRAEIGRAHV